MEEFQALSINSKGCVRDSPDPGFYPLRILYCFYLSVMLAPVPVRVVDDLYRLNLSIRLLFLPKSKNQISGTAVLCFPAPES